MQQDLDLAFVQLRIAIGVHQALFGRDQRALAIHVNGTPFHHEWSLITVAAFDLQYFPGDEIVLVPREIQSAVQAAPAVEHPVDAANIAAPVHDERRSDIAHPGIVARHLHDADGVRQHRPCVDVLGARHRNGDRLAGRNRGRDGGECLLRGLRAHAPVTHPLGPEQPAAGMRFEFAGHVEAIGGRGRLQQDHARNGRRTALRKTVAGSTFSMSRASLHQIVR